MVIRNDKMRDAFLELSKAVWQVLEDHRKEGHPLLTIERKKANWTEIGLIVTIHCFPPQLGQKATPLSMIALQNLHLYSIDSDG